MPGETQLAKLFTGLHQRWFYITGLVVLSLIRKWLLSKPPERLTHSSPRDRRTPSRTSDRRSAALPSAYAQVSRQARGRIKWRPHQRTGNHDKPEAESEPVVAATEAEMGKWNFEGRRRWDWMHDGMKPNGWVEFGTDGVLRTSLCNGGRGQWELRTNNEMVITFGTCQHIVSLLPQESMFEVQERVMNNGKPSRGRQGDRATRGRLDLSVSIDNAAMVTPS